MSWLLFLDESGHDHHNMPYEVHGGIAVHAGKLWPLIQALHRLEVDCFGDQLAPYRKEIKGRNLLDRDRVRWSGEGPWMTAEARRKLAKSFLAKGVLKQSPTSEEFVAYGQACMTMGRGIFELLRNHDAVLFAAAIPKGVAAPKDGAGSPDRLRKDLVFLLERFFYFLEGRREHGLIVMDQIEDQNDRRLVRQMEAYFGETRTGRYRTQWIVPAPIFVSSAMSYGVQVADVCIYCLNWGFRLNHLGMDAPVRQEIADEFGPWLNRLQFQGDGYKDGNVFRCFGIVFVPDPYTGREVQK